MFTNLSAVQINLLVPQLLRSNLPGQLHRSEIEAGLFAALWQLPSPQDLVTACAVMAVKQHDFIDRPADRRIEQFRLGETRTIGHRHMRRYFPEAGRGKVGSAAGCM
jgi:hypothetical protein